jgi:hypothetical protein
MVVEAFAIVFAGIALFVYFIFIVLTPLRRLVAYRRFRALQKEMAEELKKRLAGHSVIELGVTGVLEGVPFRIEVFRPFWLDGYVIPIGCYVPSGLPHTMVIQRKFPWDNVLVLSGLRRLKLEPYLGRAQFEVMSLDIQKDAQFFRVGSIRERIERVLAQGCVRLNHLYRGYEALRYVSKIEDLPSALNLRETVSSLGQLPCEKPRPMLTL